MPIARLLIVIVLALAGPAPLTAAEPPHIILILADDLGFGDVRSFNPDSPIPTPHMDRLAAEGTRFTDAHSPSAVCTPTRYGLLTGRYAWRTRLKSGVLWGPSRHLIEPGRVTLPSLLASRGYTTACVGKWHLGLDWAANAGADLTDDGHPRIPDIDYDHAIGHGPTTLGFDRFFGIPASLDMAPYVYVEGDRAVEPASARTKGAKGLRFWRAGPIAPGFHMEGVLGTLTDRAVAIIDAHATAREGQPLFLYFALPAPHTPVLPLAPFAGRSGAGAYGDFVMQVDAEIGRVLAALDRNAMARSTLVIVTSDNGSTMTDRALAEYGHRANAPWRGRKSDAWEGGHRVPFIARWPGVTPAGATCDVPVGLADMLATCAAVTGPPAPAGAGADGVDVSPLLRGEAAPALEARAIVHHSINGTFAIRAGRWKLILAKGSGGWSLKEKDAPPDAPPGQLYDMNDDPTETTNLYTAHPDIVARLTRTLDRIKEARPR